MVEEKAPPGEITQNDKLMAAISYPIALLAIIILLVESMKVRAFQKYHAIQALAANIALWIIVGIGGCLVTFILGIITTPVGGIGGFVGACLWPLLLIVGLILLLYWAYQAYQGKYFDIPVITDFIKKQGWV